MKNPKAGIINWHKNKKTAVQWSACLLILVLSALLLAPPVRGQTPDEPADADAGYTLTWWTVDGGGSSVGSGAYTLSSTAGQPDAAVVAANGYTLYGGFWGGGGRMMYSLYLPLVMRLCR